MGCGGRRAGGGRALAWDRGARGSSRIGELRAVGLGSAGQRWGARCCREPGSAARGRGARGSPGWEAQAGAGERGAARGWGAQAARAGKQGAGGGGGGARAREAGAGAREAPPLTITIDAPRIMKIMVFALMDIGRGRAGPERRPPAPAPPRPRPDAGPPPPLQRSARRAPAGEEARRAGRAGTRPLPGSLGRRAAALAAPARSAPPSASSLRALGAAPASAACPPSVPASREGPRRPPAPPRAAGRTPPRGPQGGLWPVPALVACPAPLDPGATAAPAPAVLERALGFPPRPSSCASGPPALGWHQASSSKYLPLAAGPAGRSLQSHGHMAQQRPKDAPQWGRGQPPHHLLSGVSTRHRDWAAWKSRPVSMALCKLPHDPGILGGAPEPSHHPQPQASIAYAGVPKNFPTGT